MESKVYSLQGKEVGKIKLPIHFQEEFRPDLIKRAVLAEQSKRFKPMGTDPRAGKRSTAKFVGARRKYGHYYGYGIARVPRITIGGRPVGDARNVPFAVKGRSAHPPKVGEVKEEGINKKEKKKALRSAIAATAIKDVVVKRGHRFDGDCPIIIEDKLQSLSKTKEVVEVLKKLGLDKELERAGEKKVRAGRGKTRGRKYKRRVGPLIVVGKDEGLIKAASGIPGVDAVKVDELTCESLAPGTHPGRLTIWSKGAIENLEKMFR